MTKTTIISAFAILLLTGSTLAQNNNVNSVESAKKGFNARVMQKGGFVVYPNSQKGSVAIIDIQDSISIEESFNEVFQSVKRQIPVKIEYIKKSAAEYTTLKSQSKANFAVILTSEEKLPPSMIVPEEGYAVVNLEKYKKGLSLPKDNAAYKKRCAKATLKAFMLLCGGCASRYPGHVGTALSVCDLDLSHDKIPIDIQDGIKKYLSSAGVTPLRRTIYKKAVEEGWAPAPTNDIQKAIWDKIHAMPTAPIKIKPETKKVRE